MTRVNVTSSKSPLQMPQFSPKLYIGTFITYFVYRNRLAAWCRIFQLTLITLFIAYCALAISTSTLWNQGLSEIKIMLNSPSEAVLSTANLCDRIIEKLNPDLANRLMQERECKFGLNPVTEKAINDLLMAVGGDSMFVSSSKFTLVAYVKQLKPTVTWIKPNGIDLADEFKAAMDYGSSLTVISKNQAESVSALPVVLVETKLDRLTKSIEFGRKLASQLVLIKFDEPVLQNLIPPLGYSVEWIYADNFVVLGTMFL